MLDNFLKFEHGQRLRILPFNQKELSVNYNIFHNRNINPFILDKNSPIKFTSDITCTSRNYFLVEYYSELRIIQTGWGIRTKIEEYFTDPIGNYFFNGQHLFDCYVCLELDIKKRNGFPDYSGSMVFQSPSDSGADPIEVFNTQEYDNLMSNFNKYIRQMRLETNTKTIRWLDENDYIKGNYNYLLRNIKINDIKTRKTNATKLKLWNHVGKIMEDRDINDKRFNDIGYHKIDEKGNDVHQFMIDGYLFEIKLLEDL